MILCVGTTPAVQRVMVFRKLTLDAVNRAVTTLEGAAGKSINVVKVLHALGEHPVATGFLGGDRGDWLRAVLTARGIEHEFVATGARTRECVTVIDEATGRQTELVEESPAAAPADFDRLLALVEQRAPQSRALVLSGTIASGGPPDFYQRCARLATSAGAMSVVDAQGRALVEALAARPGLVKPNRAELAATLGRELPDLPAVKAGMQELVERGAQRVVVTAGKEPLLAFDGQTCWRVTPPPVAAVNPIGSGDSLTAGVVSRLVRGDDLGEACRWGVAAGAANALTLMPGELNPEDVDRLARGVQVERA